MSNAEDNPLNSDLSEAERVEFLANAIAQLTGYDFNNVELLRDASCYIGQSRTPEAARSKFLETKGDRCLDAFLRPLFTNQSMRLLGFPECANAVSIDILDGLLRNNVLLAHRALDTGLADFFAYPLKRKGIFTEEVVRMFANPFEAIIGAICVDAGVELSNSGVITKEERMVRNVLTKLLFPGGDIEHPFMQSLYKMSHPDMSVQRAGMSELVGNVRFRYEDKVSSYYKHGEKRQKTPYKSMFIHFSHGHKEVSHSLEHINTTLNKSRFVISGFIKLIKTYPELMLAKYRLFNIYDGRSEHSSKH